MLTKKHPDLRPRMTVAPARSALVEVMAGRLDFALFLSGAKQSGIVVKTLATVRSTLVVSPRARSSKEIVRRFVGSLDIDDERTHSFPALEWLREHYGNVEQVLSCNNLETIKRIVVRGGGVAILPLYMIQKELDTDRLQNFDQKYFYDGQLKLIMRAGENLSVRAKVLIDAIEHYAAELPCR